MAVKEHVVVGPLPKRDASFEDVEEATRHFFFQAGLFWERLQDLGFIHGSGHHMAQALSEQQIEELKERWNQKRDT